jgi:DNA polymerase III delta prime subunit
MKEIEGRRARVVELHEKQLRNIDAAMEREKARHDKRVEQINAQ